MTTTNEARIEISTMCNYTCIFCPHKDKFSRKKEIMPNTLFNNILNKIKQEKNIKIITLSGLGEMLIDKDFLYKIKLAKKAGYIVNILTNGSLLTNEIIKKLEILELDSIRLSLHTTNPKQYKQITGASEDTHHKVSETIERLINSSIEFIISCDIVDINKDDVQNIIDKYSNRVDLLEIWKPHNWVSFASYRENNKVKKTCGRPFKGPLQIQVDGTMNMCCFDYNGELYIGDLKTQTIKEVYNSDEYNYIKECHTTGNMKDLICKDCDQLNKSDPEVVIYNSKFNAKDRIGKTSTAYENIEKEEI